jgi:tight adherence protein B
MTNQLMLALLTVPVLLGAALVWAMRVERRRQSVQQRLQAVAAVGRGDTSEPVLRVSLLRRTLSNAGPGKLFSLPSKLWARLDPAFAAAGYRVGMPHLVAAASISATLVISFAHNILALNPAIGVGLAGMAAVAAPFALLRFAQSRYRNRFLDIFPDALDLVGRAVKAGLPVNEAMNVAARDIADPVGSEMRRTLEQMQIGVEMIAALEQMANRVRVPDFRFLVVALTLQRKTGGALAETLTNLSAVIRARKALRLKARALSAEAKASAAVLAALPFVVGLLMYILNRDLGNVLLYDPRGRFMIGVAFLSLLTGLGTMSAMVKRALR